MAEPKEFVPEKVTEKGGSASGTPRSRSGSLDGEGAIDKPVRIDPASVEGNAKAYEFTDKHFKRMTKPIRLDLLRQVDTGLRSTGRDQWENWINHPTHTAIAGAYKQKFGRDSHQTAHGTRISAPRTAQFDQAFAAATKNKAKGCLEKLGDRSGDTQSRAKAIPALCALLNDIKFSKIVRGILEGDPQGDSTMHLCREIRQYVNTTYAGDPTKKAVLLAKIPK